MYFIIDKTTREIIRQSATPFNVDEKVQPKGSAIQLKMVEDNTQPTFDQATEKLERYSDDDDAAATRTFKFRTVALTTAEKAAKAQSAIDKNERRQAKDAIVILTDPATTAAQWKTTVNKVLVRLIKDTIQ